MMTERAVPIKYLDDITECPICSNIFSDPRVLPCIHTFCLKCIEGWAASRKPGDQKLACPLCRKEITTTKDQLTQLPKNLFVDKLLEAKKLSCGQTNADEVTTECDMCSADKASAVAYCVDWQLNMCLQCKEGHKKIRVCSSHRFVERQSVLDADELLVKLSTCMCDKHRDKPMDVYCVECKTAMCVMCFIKGHKAHECVDVNEVAEELSLQMKSDCDNVDKKTAQIGERLDKLAEKEKVFLDAAGQLEDDVVERIEEMKRWIERRKVELLSEVESVKRKERKEIETVRHELEGQLMMIDSFKKYSVQLREKGSACDLAREVGSLHSRAEELLELGSADDAEQETLNTEVTFYSNAILDNIKELIGGLNVRRETKRSVNVVDDCKTDQDEWLNCKKPLLIVPSSGQQVGGVSTLGDEVFVVRNGVKHVDVYDATTMKVQRQLQLSTTATGSNYGLVVCPVFLRVYVADYNGNCIHKTNVDGKSPASQWAVGKNPLGLSISSKNNLLVSCFGAHKIDEYTSLGLLVREITLHPDITYPAHAVQLANGHYAVTHEGYSVVDSNGKIVRSYRAKSTASTYAPLSNYPRCLAISKRGFVFIAQYSGNVVAIDGSTFRGQELNIDCNVGGTWCVHIDNSRDRLYIGEWSNGRIIVLGRK